MLGPAHSPGFKKGGVSMPHVRNKASSPTASGSITRFVLPVICYLYILLFAVKGQAKQGVALPAPAD
jgi:fucose permease